LFIYEVGVEGDGADGRTPTKLYGGIYISGDLMILGKLGDSQSLEATLIGRSGFRIANLSQGSLENGTKSDSRSW